MKFSIPVYFKCIPVYQNILFTQLKHAYTPGYVDGPAYNMVRHITNHPTTESAMSARRPSKRGISRVLLGSSPSDQEPINNTL